jgi:hypothetical protein
LTADQARSNDANTLMVLKLGKGAAAYLTRRFGVDALGVLEDALNQHAETYAWQITHLWQGRPETIIQFLVPQLRVRLRAIIGQTSGKSGHGYFFVVAAEKITKPETYEAWAHPIHGGVIVLRENEHEITRCGICTRPLPSNNGDVEKCPYCLHQYKDDTAIVKVDTEPVPLMVQFDVAALTPDEDHQASGFGIAFHPDASEHLRQLQRKERATIMKHVTKNFEGYRCGVLKLRSGAYIAIAKRLPTTRDDDRDRRTELRLLDKQLRETHIGYILDPYELRQAQAKADRWSKTKPH